MATNTNPDRPELPPDDPNYPIQQGTEGFNSSDDDDLDNLDFAANERGFERNDEASFLSGSQENHGQHGDQTIPRAGESDQ